MASINQNDSFYANNKRTLEFTITNKDVDPVAALDLTGKHLRWSMSRQNDDGSYSTNPVLQKTLSSGITVTDAAGGVAEVLLDAIDTLKLSGKYHHELEVLDADDTNAVIVATGTLTILKNITNS